MLIAILILIHGSDNTEKSTKSQMQRLRAPAADFAQAETWQPVIFFIAAAEPI